MVTWLRKLAWRRETFRKHCFSDGKSEHYEDFPTLKAILLVLNYYCVRFVFRGIWSVLIPSQISNQLIKLNVFHQSHSFSREEERLVDFFGGLGLRGEDLKQKWPRKSREKMFEITLGFPKVIKFTKDVIISRNYNCFTKLSSVKDVKHWIRLFWNLSFCYIFLHLLLKRRGKREQRGQRLKRVRLR